MADRLASIGAAALHNPAVLRGAVRGLASRFGAIHPPACVQARVAQRWHSSTPILPPPAPVKALKFHQLDLAGKRSALIADRPELKPLFDGADRVDQAYLGRHGEMVVGTSSLPMGFVPGVIINGKPFGFVFVTEESSVGDGVSAKTAIINRNGGFISTPATPVMHNHVQLIGPAGMDDPDALRVVKRLSDGLPRYLEHLNQEFARMATRTGGFSRLEIIPLPPQKTGERWMFEIRGTANVGDAQGAVYLTRAAEFLRAQIIQDMQDHGLIPGMGILCQTGQDRMATARIRLDPKDLEVRDKTTGKVIYTGQQMAQRLVWGSQFSWRVPDGFRTDTETKGGQNFLDGFVRAIGGDTRGVAASVMRAASQHPLVKWWLDEAGFVNAEATVPFTEGPVGGDRSPQAKLAIALTGANDAAEMSMVGVCGWLAQHFAALFSLMGKGIIASHVPLVERRQTGGNAP